jgi:hypothetical protein
MEVNDHFIYMFYKFLEKHNAVDAFKNNIKTPKYYLDAPLFSLIKGSFIWSDTEEGTMYWMQLNKEWRELLRKHGLLNPMYVWIRDDKDESE